MAKELTGATLRLRWVRSQLQIALEILDNPGGGLVFGYQAMGQARSHLAESEPGRWDREVENLLEAERQAVWRNFPAARALVEQVLKALPEG